MPSDSGRRVHLSPGAGVAVHGARIHEGHRGRPRSWWWCAARHTFLTEAAAREQVDYRRGAAASPPGTTDRGCSSWRRRSPPYASAAASGGASGAAGRLRPRPHWSSRNRTGTGSHQWAYSVDTLSRAWLPARDVGGAAGQTRAAGRCQHGVHHRRGGVAAAGGDFDRPARPDRGAGRRVASRGRHRGLHEDCVLDRILTCNAINRADPRGPQSPSGCIRR